MSVAMVFKGTKWPVLVTLYIRLSGTYVLYKYINTNIYIKPEPLSPWIRTEPFCSVEMHPGEVLPAACRPQPCRDEHS